MYALIVLFSSALGVRGVHNFLRCSVNNLQWVSTSPSALGIFFFTGGGPDWYGLRTRRVASESLSHSICSGDKSSMVPSVMSSSSCSSLSSDVFCVVVLSGGFWLLVEGWLGLGVKGWGWGLVGGSGVGGMWSFGVSLVLSFVLSFLRFSF